VRYAGIDVASRTHVVAIVDDQQAILVKPTSVTEDAHGYGALFGLLGSADDLLVVMEATGHYHRNLATTVTARGYRLAVVNPLRIRRFADEDLRRGKTDRVDSVSIAQFGAQKRLAPTLPTDADTADLRELVRLYGRAAQDRADKVRQLHRAVHLCFPELTRLLPTIDSQRAIAILRRFPTARSFQTCSHRTLATVRSDSQRHRIGPLLARKIIDAAALSVAQHHGPAYQREVQALCDDIDVLRQRAASLADDIDQRVTNHPIANLIMSIPGVESLTAARIVAAVGDPSRLPSGDAPAAYVGVVPGDRRSGLHQPGRAPLSPFGNRELRHALYMTTLGAVRRNPWLAAFYQRLTSAGKPAKVALTAAQRKLLLAVYAVVRDRKPFVCRGTEQS
jgi:transposase